MGNNTPARPRNAGDLKRLLQQYEKVLTPENRHFITELIAKLDGGADKMELQELAQRMQRSAARQQKK